MNENEFIYRNFNNYFGKNVISEYYRNSKVIEYVLKLNNYNKLSEFYYNPSAGLMVFDNSAFTKKGIALDNKV